MPRKKKPKTIDSLADMVAALGVDLNPIGCNPECQCGDCRGERAMMAVLTEYVTACDGGNPPPGTGVTINLPLNGAGEAALKSAIAYLTTAHGIDEPEAVEQLLMRGVYSLIHASRARSMRLALAAAMTRAVDLGEVVDLDDVPPTIH